MHDSSIREMTKFADNLPKTPLKIADIGSFGTLNYASLFARPGWQYIGMDLHPGPNVHRVLPDPYVWSNVETGEFDVVVSGQCVEHVAMPWRWIKEISRITKRGGVVCIIGPHSWEFHPAPLDCWRLWPDGMKALLEEAGLDIEVCFKNENDTVGIAIKP